MNHREFALGSDLLSFMMAGKNLDLQHTIDIRTGSIIDLGKQTIEVCEVPGHTPGSVVFWNPQQNLLFTGDAIGSGYGVWMQVPQFNPLNLGLLADLIDLVDKILAGEIVGRFSDVQKTFTPEPILYANFGRAEILYLASNVHLKC